MTTIGHQTALAELGLTEEELSRVPLGRNRFLRVAGAALFGLTTQLVAPQAAEADCAPYPCHGYCQCSCCSGYDCCSSCTRRPGYCTTQTANCWYVCDGGYILYLCCDYNDNGNPGSPCICRGFVQYFC